MSKRFLLLTVVFIFLHSMFGDLVGFTAVCLSYLLNIGYLLTINHAFLLSLMLQWSSMREPTQVFTLLETLYHAFDQ
jgi:hypothetical protein